MRAHLLTIFIFHSLIPFTLSAMLPPAPPSLPPAKKPAAYLPLPPAKPAAAMGENGDAQDELIMCHSKPYAIKKHWLRPLVLESNRQGLDFIFAVIPIIADDIQTTETSPWQLLAAHLFRDLFPKKQQGRMSYLLTKKTLAASREIDVEDVTDRENAGEDDDESHDGQSSSKRACIKLEGEKS